MLTPKIENDPPARFPWWLGPLWLFTVFLAKGYDWEALFVYGGIPWLGAWVVWRQLARSQFVRDIESATVDKIWLSIAVLAWAGVVILGAGIYYVNHYLPKGPMIDIGGPGCDPRDDVCEVENTRGLDLPPGAIYLKGSGALLLWIGLMLVGSFASARPSGGYRPTEDRPFR